ncbi:hypothetical protein GQ54DRAFT_305621 [Martensiomyces pterosporus]|nr:hypothetical protein GQ54DRAFT_305621 [Martensiomyces pterosporus]
MFRSQRKRLLLTLAFAAFAHKSAVSAACLSLKASLPSGTPMKVDSQGCPGYAHEFISTNATGRFSWYPTNDITAFDRALSEYVNGQANLDEFQAVFRCPGLDELGGFNANHGRSAIRYHRSMICADILNSDENLQECYRGSQNTHARRGVAGDDGGWLLAKVVASSAGERRDSPAPLCRSTCSAWIDSLKAITANTTLCPANSGINRDVSLQSLREKCKWPTYSGASGACVRGDDNEIGTCGYQRVEDWCRYCKYATDYEDTCASVGIYFKSSTNDNKSKSGAPSPTNIHEPNEELVAELEKQSHQEKLYRIAAIILSIAVGVCLIALMVVVAMSGAGGLRLPGLGSAHEKTPLSGARGGDGDGGDGGILGSNTAERVGRATDFVDCFVSAVGKPRQVLRHFFARRDDEISLQQGDVVTLQMAFDDGWVVGKNLTTGCEGTFPLMCVMEALPPSLPAQWSVLPEFKRASVDNVRRPSMAATRSSPRSSLPDEISVPVSYDAGPQLAQPRGTQHGRTGSNSQLEGSRLSVNLPNRQRQPNEQPVADAAASDHHKQDPAVSSAPSGPQAEHRLHRN